MIAAVFVGPSLPAARAAELLPQARVEPPAGRGDIERLLDAGVDTFLIIDGAFAHRAAVSPGEIVTALEAGARILGAASLGAIRAAECAPAGMAGAGAIAWLYRIGLLRDDDEVAVAVEPDRGWRAASVALINVRFAMLVALRRGLLDRPAAARVLAAAKRMHFSRREWRTILAAAGLEAGPALVALCEATDVKRRDAELAVRRLASDGSGGRRLVTRRQRSSLGPRYRGHDALLGRSVAELAPALAAWLVGSGRYRGYEGLPATAGPAEVWARLEREHELGPELMRLYAVQRAAGERGSADGPPLGPFLETARFDVAAAHGHAGWAELEVFVGGGPGGSRILARARAAAHALALARRNAGTP